MEKKGYEPCLVHKQRMLSGLLTMVGLEVS